MQVMKQNNKMNTYQLNPGIKMIDTECAHLQSDCYPELCVSFLVF